jgi:hypothetical protein
MYKFVRCYYFLLNKLPNRLIHMQTIKIKHKINVLKMFTKVEDFECFAFQNVNMHNIL